MRGSIWRSIAATTVVATVMIGCGSKDAKVIGKWKEAGKSETLEFFVDHRISAADGTLALAGSWQFLPDGRLKVEVSAMGQSLILTGGVEGPHLWLVDPKNDTSRYERVDQTSN